MISQEIIVNQMKALGYKADDRGVCYGITHMAMQALFANEIDKFNDRINLLNTVNGEQLISKIESALKEVEKLNDDQSIESLGEEVTKWLDIKGFFDGIELYYQVSTNIHREEKKGEKEEKGEKILFSEFLPTENRPSSRFQDAKKIMPFLLPNQLKSKSDKENEKSIQYVNEFIGAYNIDELIAYLDKFPQENTDMALMLGSSNHAIMIVKNKDNTWSFCNPNTLPIELKIVNTNDLAEKIMCGFQLVDMKENKEYKHDSTPIIFQTQVIAYENKNELLKLKTNSEIWQNEVAKLDEKKLEYSDKSKFNLLMLAAKLGDANTVKKLLSMNIEFKHNQRSDSPLELAACLGHADVVELLLANSQYVYSSNEINNALLDASNNGDINMVSLLINKGNSIDINAKSEDFLGNTALILAAENGHINVVKLLLDKGAKINEDNIHRHRSPLFFAAREGHIEIVRLLIMKGADIDQEDEFGQTPLYTHFTSRCENGCLYNLKIIGNSCA